MKLLGIRRFPELSILPNHPIVNILVLRPLGIWGSPNFRNIQTYHPTIRDVLLQQILEGDVKQIPKKAFQIGIIQDTVMMINQGMDWGREIGTHFLYDKPFHHEIVVLDFPMFC